jgi:hypothetical protein
MKVAELEGAELDCWVAHAEKFEDVSLIGEKCRVVCYPHDYDSYSPSTNWALAGPIIERYEIDLEHVRGVGELVWTAVCWGHIAHGPTPLISAMRCFVASKFGDEVSDRTTVVETVYVPRKQPSLWRALLDLLVVSV